MQMTGWRGVTCCFSENRVARTTVMVVSNPEFPISHHSLNHKECPIRPEHPSLFQLPEQTFPPWLIPGSFTLFTREHEHHFFSSVHLSAPAKNSNFFHAGSPQTSQKYNFNSNSLNISCNILSPIILVLMLPVSPWRWHHFRPLSA